MRTRFIVLGIAGCFISICLILIFMTLPEKEDNSHTIQLRTEVQDGYTLDEMIQKEKKEGNPVITDLPLMSETMADETEEGLSHLQELIQENEEAFREHKTNAQENQPIITERKAPAEEKKKDMEVQKPAPIKKRRSFNSISLVKEQKSNSISAFVHSTQTVMVGSTLKMQLGENCLTDDGHRVNRGTPVYGEVTKIDGERVIIEIRQIQLNNNILPFKKKVYSRDAIEGIYVPGNPKAEIANDANAAAVSGTNTNIEGGIGIGSQLVAGATNSVINATKAATTKNIKKIKVTIKTNYQILLMEDAKI